jgi:hypothetical protein
MHPALEALLPESYCCCLRILSQQLWQCLGGTAAALSVIGAADQ